MAKIEFQLSGRNDFRKASRTAIADYFISFPPHFRNTRWLRQNNEYRVDCVNVYTHQVQPPPPRVNHPGLADYIAASGPAHAIDGWSFFGRAVQSLLQGDGYSAVHFAYYAELRAAMALLATEGFGVFNKRHPVVSSRTQTIDFPKCQYAGTNNKIWGATHAIIVPSLRYWATLKRAGDLLDNIVQPAAIALSDWLDACGAPTKSHAVARAWLNAWGLDLAQIDQDHAARNLVSYRPSEFRRPATANVDRLATFVRDLWTLFEPSPNFRFPNLDAQLLRLALKNCRVPPPTAVQIEHLGLTNGEATTWAAVLSNPHLPVPLTEAMNESSIESERCPMQIISRAAMLLFVATRSGSLHLANAGYTRADLSFWWKRFGTDRCLWNRDAVPDDPRDAWADIKDGLDDIETSITDPIPNCLKSWRGRLLDLKRSINDFTVWELVAVWGLVP